MTDSQPKNEPQNAYFAKPKWFILVQGWNPEKIKAGGFYVDTHGNLRQARWPSFGSKMPAHQLSDSAVVALMDANEKLSELQDTHELTCKALQSEIESWKKAHDQLRASVGLNIQREAPNDTEKSQPEKKDVTSMRQILSTDNVMVGDNLLFVAPPPVGTTVKCSVRARHMTGNASNALRLTALTVDIEGRPVTAPIEFFFRAADVDAATHEDGNKMPEPATAEQPTQEPAPQAHGSMIGVYAPAGFEYRNPSARVARLAAGISEDAPPAVIASPDAPQPQAGKANDPERERLLREWGDGFVFAVLEKMALTAKVSDLEGDTLTDVIRLSRKIVDRLLND